MTAVLYGWAITSLGWGNDYYAAAVKSMGRNWTNFLFGAYDPAGVVTVDKPPAALWPQVLSTKIFGMHGWALILPQVIEGVATVALLHRTVRRWAGEGAALLAALVLALTPITVAINRDNNPDTLLVLLLVAAAYALTRALQSDRGREATWWLCASGFLIGGGFLTKMLAAWMVVPVFAAAWLIGAGGPWLTRLRRLLAAGAVLAASSLWWVALVALWPGDHPYIGGSKDGSAWDLVMGYNGLGRIFGEGDGPANSNGSTFGGPAGLSRLFNDQNAGQISWLFPVCAAALLVAVATAVLRRRGGTAGEPLAAAGWVLWGGWLLICAAVFSTQRGIFHPYYSTQLAPAVGALAGGLLAQLVRAHRAGARWPGAVGAVTVLGTAAWAAVVIRRVPTWHGWLVWPVAAAGAAAGILLILAAWRWTRLLPSALGTAVVAVLLAPGVWSAIVPFGSNAAAAGGALVNAGPLQSGGAGMIVEKLPGGTPKVVQIEPGAKGGAATGPQPAPQGDKPGKSVTANGGPAGGEDQSRILNYVRTQAPSARIALAVGDGGNATELILSTDLTVIGMGGFGGTDDAPSVEQLARWAANGELRYVLRPDRAMSPGTGAGAVRMSPTGKPVGTAAARSAWMDKHCTKVPASAYGGTSDSTLYDCAPK